MDEFVTIATFDRPDQAALVRAALESEGIESWLRDEHTSHILSPFHGGAAVGVRVQVKTADGERARTVAEPMLTAEGRNRGHRVFRVRATKLWSFGLWGLAGGVLAAVIASLFELRGVGWIVATLSLVAGAILGATRRDDFCSDCGAGLEPRSTICSRCHGDVAGEIRHANERLDALERLGEPKS